MIITGHARFLKRWENRRKRRKNRTDTKINRTDIAITPVIPVQKDTKYSRDRTGRYR